VPLMVTFFNVRQGVLRDTMFKRGMRHLFPKRAREYEERYGIRFIGWFNVTEGSEWNNVIIFDLPNYTVLDELYADPATRKLGHSVAESIMSTKHVMFLRERMGPDLVYKP
jgi:hypothetical protein